MNYSKLNTLLGWIMFVFAMIVYTLTVEPTASFWDCGEFIAVSYKMMVPHPPGAPFFLLIGRIFSFFAFGDLTQVAFWVNMVSVSCSALTIMFLFWTITILARRLVVGNRFDAPSQGQMIGIFGSGIIGAAAFSFSDSFWFSAGEAEVYAMSSAFTAVVFWAMLKWEARAHLKDADRWLLLIAYLVGLSIGVHLLNLVAIPALATIYYYKKFKPSTLGFLTTIAIGGAITVFITFFIIPGLPSIAGSFEILFVNSFGLPFGSGVIFFSLALLGVLVYGIIYSIQKKNRLLNLGLTALAFILIGYSSYGIIVIRSNDNPTIDENNPENVLSFVSYLKREQYGDRPIVHGPQFTAQLIEQKKGDPIYVKENGRYKIVDHKTENIFDPKHETLFPRMYSKQGRHIRAYPRWVDMPGLERREDGSWTRKPTFGENLSYFFNYQIRWMFMRYFLWNFAGREADWQNANFTVFGESAKQLPHSLELSKARNIFFGLPLLLGILGLFYQSRKNERDAAVVGLLFFFTGIAVILYLNQPPIEPRERDYTYAGAFYAFSIWIGLGVLMVADLLKKVSQNNQLRYGIATALCLIVPGIMAAEGWDDHDRSGRWHSVDSAKNLLNSCEKNAIIFTGGDNDTFPLWYIQEVEGFRTDVRVCNLSLLGTDWYISQMKQDAYESPALPITMEYAKNYIQGTNDYIPYVRDQRFEKRFKNGMPLETIVRLIREEDPAVMRSTQSDGRMAVLPIKHFRLPVPKDHDAKSYLPQDKHRYIQGELNWKIGRKALYKNHLIMLDILAHNKWERPIYFSTTLGGSDYLGLKPYMQLEGLAYRLTPAKPTKSKDGFVNAELSYERMMNNMYWRGMDDPDVFYDENYLRFPLNARNSFYKMAKRFMQKGNKEKALEVIEHCNTIMPDKAIPYDVYTVPFAEIYFQAGKEEKAMELLTTMADRAIGELEYWSDEEQNGRPITNLLRQPMYILYQSIDLMEKNGKKEEAKQYRQTFMEYNQSLQGILGRG